MQVNLEIGLKVARTWRLICWIQAKMRLDEGFNSAKQDVDASSEQLSIISVSMYRVCQVGAEGRVGVEFMEGNAGLLHKCL